MQRPIEFRIWDIEEKTWIDPRIWHNANSFFYINELGEVSFFRTEAEGRFIIHQFTGLKDKNGKKIFEGDQIRIDFPPLQTSDGRVVAQKPLFAEIGFDEFTRGFCLKNCGGQLVDRFSSSCEIIGNIFEAPEPLK